MKCEVKYVEVKPVFKPVSFTFTAESEADLRELWHRFNMVPGHMSISYKEQFKITDSMFNNYHNFSNWKAIDKVMNSLNIPVIPR